MYKRKTTDRHLEVLRQQVAAYNDSPTGLVDWFQAQENADRFGFEPIKLCKQRIHQLIHEIEPEELVKLRKEFLGEFDDCPLSHKKMRVMELAKMYRKANNPIAQQSILRDIRGEMGEDLEKLRGDTNITIINSQERFNERLARAMDFGANVIGRNN